MQGLDSRIARITLIERSEIKCGSEAASSARTTAAPETQPLFNAAVSDVGGDADAAVRMSELGCHLMNGAPAE